MDSCFIKKKIQFVLPVGVVYIDYLRARNKDMFYMLKY